MQSSPATRQGKCPVRKWPEGGLAEKRFGIKLPSFIVFFVFFVLCFSFLGGLFEAFDSLEVFEIF